MVKRFVRDAQSGVFAGIRFEIPGAAVRLEDKHSGGSTTRATLPRAVREKRDELIWEEKDGNDARGAKKDGLLVRVVLRNIRVIFGTFVPKSEFVARAILLVLGLAQNWTGRKARQI